MDFLEKIFEKTWKPSWKKEKSLETTIHVNDIKKYLEVVGHFCLNDFESVDLVASRYYIGLSGHQIYLPEWIGFHKNQRLNRNNYLYLILKCCISEKLKLKDSGKSLSRRGQRLDLLCHMPEINRTLDNIFPAFKDLEKVVLDSIQLLEKRQSSDPVYRAWKSVISSREEISEKDLKVLKAPLQSNDEVPAYLFLTVPCLPKPQVAIEVGIGPVDEEQKKRQTEKEKPTGEHVKQVSLEDDKKDANPITHAFEKMETVDDYQGSYRFDSGDDDLESHANALDEVELSQVTIDGESAKSVYKAESSLLLQMKQNFSEPTGPSETFYPEWNEGKGLYFDNHCRILVKHDSEKNVDSNFKSKLEDENRQQIEVWRNKINKVVNEPLWKHRQKDGPEIDYDAAVRYLIDVHVGNSTEDRLFSTKKNLNRDVSVLILFDQSYSTDSWVQNIRVIDTIIGSIGMCGLLFEGIIDNIKVAGTWSATRHHCEFQVYKEAHQDWANFYQRAPLIEPKGYTRLGPAIRHSIELLKKQKTKRKLLLLLTDGKPSDLDRYEGKHGIYDVKKACLEAEDVGILPYAITVEKGEKSHFSTMFKHYSVVQSCEAFSEEVFKAIVFAIK